MLTATALTAFGAVCINTTAGPNSFTVSSNALLTANVNIGPLNGYSFSTTSGGTYTSTLSLVQPGGAYSQTIYVKFSPTAVQSYNGNIPVSGGGAPVTINVAASGSGINTIATVVTGNAIIFNPNSATLDGSITSIGCSNVTSYGIEYSSIGGLANGLGTKVPASNLSAGAFSSTLSGLVQGSKYYYKAYAINNGGIAYGVEKSFTTSNIPDGFIIYSTPIQRGGRVHITLKDIKPGHYSIQFFNAIGQQVDQQDVIIQVNFIDTWLTLPGKLGSGYYTMAIATPDFIVKKRFMIW
ncbi:MAG: hypothetical protein IPI66_06930 [Chitinophagaceae bacterium]|nr:hypothetical protein [Chitinophagaceae bacterium]